MRRIVALVVLLGLPAASIATERGPDGAELYFRYCASCHGIGGHGDGPDASLFLPRPRNLREGITADRETSELVKLILDGARRPLALDPQALRARLTDTAAIAAHIETIPDINWRLATRGQYLYLDRCKTCHGPFGRPPWTDDRSPPRDLSTPAFQQSTNDDELIRAVRHGNRGMPAIPAVRSDADARALVAFVRLLSPGFELYSRHCATCHGDDGRPQREFVSARQRPSVVFDRAWLARRDPAQLRAAVSHMLEERHPGMPHFRRTLTEPEARAIVRYLRRTQ